MVQEGGGERERMKGGVLTFFSEQTEAQGITVCVCLCLCVCVCLHVRADGALTALAVARLTACRDDRFGSGR